MEDQHKSGKSIFGRNFFSNELNFRFLKAYQKRAKKRNIFYINQVFDSISKTKYINNYYVI